MKGSTSPFAFAGAAIPNQEPEGANVWHLATESGPDRSVVDGQRVAGDGIAATDEPTPTSRLKTMRNSSSSTPPDFTFTKD
jgi:hypothetical protein